jgi:osmoprotectant transport system substrate-binding protein
VFRKHTRRAAKAAFSISLGVALLIGLVAAAGGGAGTTRQSAVTVTIGTKNFTEEFILGQLYKQALEAKGYKVNYQENIGSSELTDTAITSGKINFYPEYTGVIVADLAKHTAPVATAAATYARAKAFEESRGLTLLNRTPFVDADTFTMLRSTAHRLHVTTIAQMKKVKHFSYAAFPECRTRPTCLVGLKKVYGLKQVKFVPLASISVYTLLSQKKITAGDGFTTDPQLQSRKYIALRDTKHIFGFQNVAPVITKQLATEGGAAFAAAVNAVSAKLTIKAMVAMDKAVAVDKKAAADVADAFLKANGLK